MVESDLSGRRVVLDPTIQKFIHQVEAAQGPPIFSLTPEEARDTLLRAQSTGVQLPAAHIEDRTVDSAVGRIQIRTVRPLKATDRTPAIVYFHGGGWVLGDANTHDRLVRELAVGTGATIAFVEYGRAPEHQFPYALEQAYEATRYVSEHAEEFGIDPRKLAVAGDSAGGSLAIAVTLLAKRRSRPRLTGQLLLYPVTNAAFDTDSYQQFGDGPWLTGQAMQWFWTQYLPEVSRRKDALASPLLASLDDVAGLPPTMIITAENDILRDEGEAYGRKLLQAGVETVITRYIGAIHDFLMLNSIAEAPPARAAVAQAVEFLKRVLR